MSVNVAKLSTSTPTMDNSRISLVLEKEMPWDLSPRPRHYLPTKNEAAVTSERDVSVSISHI
jgi:hypothetical protein